MKAAIDVLFRRRRKSSETAQDIDEELNFHLELLTQKHLQREMSLTEANDAAAKRFGNVERIKDQCLAIRRRSHPFLVALKSLLILTFLTGIVVRVLSTALNTRRIGDLLIAIPILAGVLLYVRNISPSSFVSNPETALSLRLNENVQPLFTAYDKGMHTPVERLISDK
ncbi:MAG TPA: permease prefix domain 1-containing protein [Pyrinomonadaceae bacterium]|nr:permease prefix domain 1-containing protein [Pyrinomonadaceae bacterium]